MVHAPQFPKQLETYLLSSNHIGEVCPAFERFLHETLLHLELYESIEGSLEGLCLGKILSCQKHSNANSLSVTLVDVGQAEPLQIVCGAPNAPQALGKHVVVATVGTTLYPLGAEPFKIKKGKIC